MGRTNSRLWEAAKAEAKRRMGGKHSARAMQLAGKIYRQRGGRYTGKKTAAQRSMTKWTKEKWGTKSGKNSINLFVLSQKSFWKRRCWLPVYGLTLGNVL